MDVEGYIVDHNEEGPMDEAEDLTDLDYIEILCGTANMFIKDSNPEKAEEIIQRVRELLKVRFRLVGFKTYLPNFMNLCHAIRRPPDHVMALFLNELGTTGSLEKQKLVLGEDFNPMIL